MYHLENSFWGFHPKKRDCRPIEVCTNTSIFTAISAFCFERDPHDLQHIIDSDCTLLGTYREKNGSVWTFQRHERLQMVCGRTVKLFCRCRSCFSIWKSSSSSQAAGSRPQHTDLCDKFLSVASAYKCHDAQRIASRYYLHGSANRASFESDYQRGHSILSNPLVLGTTNELDTSYFGSFMHSNNVFIITLDI